jgi:hypothetical protein
MLLAQTALCLPHHTIRSNRGQTVPVAKRGSECCRASGSTNPMMMMTMMMMMMMMMRTGRGSTLRLLPGRGDALPRSGVSQRRCAHTPFFFNCRSFSLQMDLIPVTFRARSLAPPQGSSSPCSASSRGSRTTRRARWRRRSCGSLTTSTTKTSSTGTTQRHRERDTETEI